MPLSCVILTGETYEDDRKGNEEALKGNEEALKGNWNR